MGVFRIPRSACEIKKKIKKKKNKKQNNKKKNKKQTGQVEVGVHDESELLSEVISRFRHRRPLQSLKTANHQFSLALRALSVRIAYMHMMF